MSSEGNFDIEFSEVLVDVDEVFIGNATLIASSVNENGRACTMLMDLHEVSISNLA